MGFLVQNWKRGTKKSFRLLSFICLLLLNILPFLCSTVLRRTLIENEEQVYRGNLDLRNTLRRVRKYNFS